MALSKPQYGEMFWRRVGLSFLLILLSAVVGTALLILSEFLPGEPMDRNLERSADIFQATGKFPNLHTWCSSRLDNYSDAIMLQMGGNVSREHPVDYAMMSYHPVMGELDPVQIFTKHYIEGVPYVEYEAYSRYWHGYGIIYRLLLLFLDYHRIRLLNAAVQIGLMLLLCWKMYRGGDRSRGMILPLLISYAMMAPAVMWMNLEYSLGFYISMFALLAMLILHRKGDLREKEDMVLLFSGICTAYWDVLTYPMAALGIPLLAACFLDPEEKMCKTLIRTVRLCFFWGMGYGLMWISKWAIGTVLTGQNVFAEGISTFLLRTGSEADGEAVSLGAMLWKNTVYFFRTPFSLLFAVYILGEVIRMLRQIRGLRDMAIEAGKSLIPYLLISLIPYVWCVVTRNHATIHFWLVTKAFIVSTMAIMCGLYQGVDVVKERNARDR